MICEREYCGHEVEEHTRNRNRMCGKCPCPIAIVDDEQLRASTGAPLTPEEKRELGFDIGQKLKNGALNAAELNHHGDLQAARLIRDRIAIERGTVTADDVREVFDKHRPNVWGSWAGSLFRDGKYEMTGEFIPSVNATRHGAVIRVWRRKA